MCQYIETDARLGCGYYVDCGHCERSKNMRSTPNIEKLLAFKEAAESHWACFGYEKQHRLVEEYERIFGRRPKVDGQE